MPTSLQMANCIRFLSVDAVQKAKSGHPGMPLGMADISEVLWSRFIKHNPCNPNWINRDRFILSNGHGSMLLYSILHLSGYDLSIDDLKKFRTLHSKTPGHPEKYITPGVETTTGPLGQGLANAVGIALAEKILSSKFNKNDFPIIDHFTYVFVGDGCLMEGISHEVSSFAGIQNLGKLIVIYDDNNISIDGNVSNWFKEDIAKRYSAYNWHVIDKVNGHDIEEINDAIKKGKQNTNQPTIICCKTTIGKGAVNYENTSKVHGAPLGDDEIKLMRKNLNWPYEPFFIPKNYYQAWDKKEQGQKWEQEWNKMFAEYTRAFPALANELVRRMNKQLPANWSTTINNLIDDMKNEQKSIATRQASQLCLEQIKPIIPELIGGSADLTMSNLTLTSTSKIINNNNYNGNYIYYGVREFGMTAIANGLCTHSGFRPYCGTFLVFSDYARNAIRMAALMKLPSIMVYTHDSIGLGEDGPTHQPIEHINSLRIIPNLSVWRPCDTVETAVAWQQAIERTDGPTALLLSRQKLSFQHREKASIDDIKKGGYILASVDNPNLILIATGSEVSIARQAYDKLINMGYSIQLVSIPSTSTFELQNKEYQEYVLPSNIKKRIIIEAGNTNYWHKYVEDGEIIGIDTFGESSCCNDLFSYFNITKERIEKLAKKYLT